MVSVWAKHMQVSWTMTQLSLSSSVTSRNNSFTFINQCVNVYREFSVLVTSTSCSQPRAVFQPLYREFINCLERCLSLSFITELTAWKINWIEPSLYVYDTQRAISMATQVLHNYSWPSLPKKIQYNQCCAMDTG